MTDLISRAAVLRMLDENGVVFRGEIEKIPAVDVIPMGWLREKIKEHTDKEGWQDYLANSFGLCIEEWQKEQEAR